MKSFRQPWKKIIAAALSLSLLTAALALVPDGAAGPPRDWIGTATRPFFRLVSMGTDQLRRGADYLRGVRRLRAENELLRRELKELRPAARLGELAQGENARLRSLLGLEEAGRELSLTSAWVLSLSPDSWSRTARLDRGASRGVEAGQYVMDEAGALVGRIAEVGRTWSVLRLVTDPAFQAAGQGCRSGVLGSLEGDLSLMTRGTLKLTCLSPSAPAFRGETVVTFSDGESGPAGLTVGTVDFISEDPGGLSVSAVLRPAADLGRLSQVFIVTEFRELR